MDFECRWRRSVFGYVSVRAVVELFAYPKAADDQSTRRVIPRIMTATTAGMVAVTVALTLFAGPLYALCASIGDALLTPVTLVQLEQEVSR